MSEDKRHYAQVHESQMPLDDYVEREFYLHDKIRSNQKQTKHALNTMFFEGGDKISKESIVQEHPQEDTQGAPGDEEEPETKGSSSSTSSSSEDEDDDVASASSSSS